MSKSKKEVKEVLEPDLTLLSRLMDADNEENIFLFDEEGNEIELEQIAIITYEKNVYAILRPLTAAEDEVVIFKIDPTDEESLNVVEDEVLAEKILDIYHTEE